MNGHDISRHTENLSLVNVQEKFLNSLVCAETDPAIGTAFIEGLFYNFHLPSDAYVYLNIPEKYEDRHYEFIKPNIGFDALMNFMDDKFPCTGCVLRPDMEGKRFSELTRQEKRRIESTGVSFIVIYATGRTTKEETLAYFRRILS